MNWIDSKKDKPKENELVLTYNLGHKQYWLLYHNPAGYWQDQYGYPHPVPDLWSKLVSPKK